jgi:hypothetical protein
MTDERQNLDSDPSTTANTATAEPPEPQAVAATARCRHTACCRASRCI